MNNSRGFTLIELIVAMGITTVLIAICATIMLTAFATVDRTAVVSERGQTASEIFWFIKRALITADEISGEAGEGGRTLDVDAETGTLMMDGTTLYDESFYGGMALSLMLEGHGDSATLTVTLTGENGGEYSESGTFRLLNAEVDGAFEVTRAESGDDVLYFIPHGIVLDRKER